MSLSDRQELFAREYVLDGNATAAAIRAGYAEKGAQVQGSRLLSNDMVSHRIAELQAIAAEKAGFDAVRVLREIEAIATVDVRDVVEWGVRHRTIYRNSKGQVLDDEHLQDAIQAGELIDETEVAEPFVLPRNSADLPPHVTAAIQSVSLDKNGNIKITMHPKTKGLEMAGRHFKMFTDVMEHRLDEPLDRQLARAIERRQKGETEDE